MNIRFSPRSEGDIEAITEYLEERSPEGARKVLRSLLLAIDFIKSYPYGAEETDDAKLRVKILTDYRYKIFYDIGHEAIEIVHIRHDARRSWRK